MAVSLHSRLVAALPRNASEAREAFDPHDVVRKKQLPLQHQQQQWPQKDLQWQQPSQESCETAHKNEHRCSANEKPTDYLPAAAATTQEVPSVSTASVAFAGFCAPQGLVVRTYRGIVDGTEDEDPEGMNPKINEVQVAWEDGTVENIARKNLELVDRPFFAGDFVTNESGEALGLVVDVQQQLAVRLLSTTAAAAENRQSFVASRQTAAASSSEPAATTAAAGAKAFTETTRAVERMQRLGEEVEMERSPAGSANGSGDCSHSSSSAFSSEMKAAAEPPAPPPTHPPSHHQHVVKYVHLNSMQNYPLPRVPPLIRPLQAFGLGTLVVKDGWIGHIVNCKIDYLIQLDSGHEFTLECGMEGVRIEPRQGYPVDPYEMFPSQKIYITGRWLRNFLQQLQRRHAQQGQSEEMAAAGAHRLCRGTVKSFAVRSVKVSWLLNAAESWRSVPAAPYVSQPSEQNCRHLLPLQQTVFRLGEPVYFNVGDREEVVEQMQQQSEQNVLLHQPFQQQESQPAVAHKKPQQEELPTTQKQQEQQQQRASGGQAFLFGALGAAAMSAFGVVTDSLFSLSASQQQRDLSVPPPHSQQLRVKVETQQQQPLPPSSLSSLPTQMHCLRSTQEEHVEPLLMTTKPQEQQQFRRRPASTTSPVYHLGVVEKLSTTCTVLWEDGRVTAAVPGGSLIPAALDRTPLSPPDYTISVALLPCMYVTRRSARKKGAFTTLRSQAEEEAAAAETAFATASNSTTTEELPWWTAPYFGEVKFMEETKVPDELKAVDVVRTLLRVCREMSLTGTALKSFCNGGGSDGVAAAGDDEQQQEDDDEEPEQGVSLNMDDEDQGEEHVGASSKSRETQAAVASSETGSRSSSGPSAQLGSPATAARPTSEKFASATAVAVPACTNTTTTTQTIGTEDEKIKAAATEIKKGTATTVPPATTITTPFFTTHQEKAASFFGRKKIEEKEGEGKEAAAAPATGRSFMQWGKKKKGSAPAEEQSFSEDERMASFSSSFTENSLSSSSSDDYLSEPECNNNNGRTSAASAVQQQQKQQKSESCTSNKVEERAAVVGAVDIHGKKNPSDDAKDGNTTEEDEADAWEDIEDGDSFSDERESPPASERATSLRVEALSSSSSSNRNNSSNSSSPAALLASAGLPLPSRRPLRHLDRGLGFLRLTPASLIRRRAEGDRTARLRRIFSAAAACRRDSSSREGSYAERPTFIQERKMRLALTLLQEIFECFILSVGSPLDFDAPINERIPVLRDVSLLERVNEEESAAEKTAAEYGFSDVSRRLDLCKATEQTMQHPYVGAAAHHKTAGRFEEQFSDTDSVDAAAAAEELVIDRTSRHFIDYERYRRQPDADTAPARLQELISVLLGGEFNKHELFQLLELSRLAFPGMRCLSSFENFLLNRSGYLDTTQLESLLNCLSTLRGDAASENVLRSCCSTNSSSTVALQQQCSKSEEVGLVLRVNRKSGTAVVAWLARPALFFGLAKKLRAEQCEELKAAAAARQKQQHNSGSTSSNTAKNAPNEMFEDSTNSRRRLLFQLKDAKSYAFLYTEAAEAFKKGEMAPHIRMETVSVMDLLPLSRFLFYPGQCALVSEEVVDDEFFTYCEELHATQETANEAAAKTARNLKFAAARRGGRTKQIFLHVVASCGGIVWARTLDGRVGPFSPTELYPVNTHWCDVDSPYDDSSDEPSNYDASGSEDSSGDEWEDRDREDGETSRYGSTDTTNLSQTSGGAPSRSSSSERSEDGSTRHDQ